MRGSWMQMPAINLTSVSDYGYNLITPYLTWWGYIKFIRICGTGKGFINIDIQCQQTCDCNVQNSEIHQKIPFSHRACADFGPNVFGMASGLLNPYLSATATILLLEASSAEAGAEVRTKIQEQGGLILKEAIAHGPTALCKRGAR